MSENSILGYVFWYVALQVLAGVLLVPLILVALQSGSLLFLIIANLIVAATSATILFFIVNALVENRLSTLEQRLRDDGSSGESVRWQSPQRQRVGRAISAD